MPVWRHSLPGYRKRSARLVVEHDVGFDARVTSMIEWLNVVTCGQVADVRAHDATRAFRARTLVWMIDGEQSSAGIR
ncbi:hypothetical protein [Paraliomyxa miuraensis]|uniref:hypothetical protein n=1 Tax=Paraliomyxa miuraensis TaxID=376150 RepID=UPI00225A97D2|nr:hypothetical protein [Paraliomyxa miuraensis]MCX4239408.1 hypothetical protein [Paraliomyxa miuraensis]